MKKPTAFITIGIPGSGKSTWAREQAEKGGCIVTCRDDIRYGLVATTKRSDYKYTKGLEAIVTSIQYHTINEAYQRRYNVIIADTNLNTHYRNILIQHLKDTGFHVEIKEFDISFEEACKRDGFRHNGVGYEVIAKFYKQYLEYKKAKTYVRDTTKPKAIICDLDGTLAHMTDRTAFQFSKCGSDAVDEAVLSILQTTPHKVILVSGREDMCYNETCTWLEKHNVPYHNLFMRATDDRRNDTIVKREIFFNYIADHYNVQFCIDDRPKVVRMWNEIGVKCLAIGNQFIDF